MGYSDFEIISGTFALLFAFISLVSTVVTLVLIFDMKRWNAYMLLIFNLTFCQFFYDLAFFFLITYTQRASQLALAFLTTFGGVSVTLWTNVISFILCSIVLNLQSFNVYGYFKIFFIAIMVPSLALAVLNIIFYDPSFEHSILTNFYYWLRIGSIVFNIAVHALISVKLSRMGFDKNSRKQDPVRVLASRLKYYPIVQIVTRVGAAWYEAAYGYNTESFDNNMNATQKTSFLLYAVCVPSAGLGYFLIFLLVQPKALAVLKARLQRYHVFRYCLGAPVALVTMDSIGNTSSSDQGVEAGHERKLVGVMLFVPLSSSFSHMTITSSKSFFICVLIICIIFSPTDRAESTASSSYKGSSDFLASHVSVSTGRGSSMALFGLLEDLDEDELAEQIDIKYCHSNVASVGTSAAGGSVLSGVDNILHGTLGVSGGSHVMSGSHSSVSSDINPL